jgi:hypothetical protein
MFVEFPNGLSAMARLAFGYLDWDDFYNEATGGVRDLRAKTLAGLAAGCAMHVACSLPTLLSACSSSLAWLVLLAVFPACSQCQPRNQGCACSLWCLLHAASDVLIL